MFLIADSGSTKTQWCVVEGEKRHTVYTSGINPIFQPEAEIRKILESGFPLQLREMERVYFYGAGCAFDDKNEQVRRVLGSFFRTGDVEVASDLLAAARSLCQREAGIVGILGTGSNSGYYDGEKIAGHVRPLGFILGDEGSGAALGKKLLADVLKGILPQPLCELFYQEYPCSYEELMNGVYRQALPNRFLAAFVPFLKKYRIYPEIERIISESMEEYVGRNILQYEKVHDLPLGFTGSVAFHFRDILKCIVEKYGLCLGQVCQAPMEGLITFHTGC